MNVRVPGELGGSNTRGLISRYLKGTSELEMEPNLF